MERRDGGKAAAATRMGRLHAHRTGRFSRPQCDAGRRRPRQGRRPDEGHRTRRAAAPASSPMPLVPAPGGGAIGRDGSAHGRCDEGHTFPMASADSPAVNGARGRGLRVRDGRGRSRVSALTGSWSPELATLPKGKLDRLAARQVPTRNLHLIAFVHALLDRAQGRESCGATEVNWHRLAPRRQSLRCVHSASADAGAAGWGTLATRLREGKYFGRAAECAGRSSPQRLQLERRGGGCGGVRRRRLSHR
jgi:hypothetical protein